MNTTIAQTLVETLTTFFSTHCKIFPPDIHNRSVPIEIPLAGFDNQNIKLFVELVEERTILHDGGYLVNYLANHEITVHSKAKRFPVYYYRFYEDLARKHDFKFSEKDRRFEMQIDPKEGQKALVFVECLIALSFLVVTKWAGLKAYSQEELQGLSGLKMTLATALPGIKVAPGLLPEVQDRSAPQFWGLTLSVPGNKNRGCVHYLRGPDWTHLLRGAIVLNKFSEMSGKWFNTKPDCFWGVYGGPPELFNDTNTILKNLGNGHSARLISFDQRETLVSEVSERLGIPARDNWRHFLKVQQEALGKRLLSKRIHEGHVPSPSAPREMQSEDLWGVTAFEHDPIGDASSAGFEAALYRLLGEAEYRSEFASEPLDTYGLAFARYVLSEIKERPSKIHPSRFNQIADTLFQYYRNDAEATETIDREVAEIEPRLNRSLMTEDAFRQEEQSANRYMMSELKSLRSELAKLIETKNG